MAVRTPPNRARTRRITPAAGRVVVVTGPPCSGKSTYVRDQAAPQDIIVDLDALAVALGSPVTHGHPGDIKRCAMDARDAVLAALTVNSFGVTAWVIATDVGPREQALASTVVVMPTSKDECHERAVRDGRPAAWHAVIDQWQSSSGATSFEPTSRTASRRW